jgi:hypothetical protein
MYATGVSEVVKQIVTEDDFIAAFLHLGDTESTFADYMELDTYFRRQASRHASHGLTASLTQLARTVMELMFGFVDGEMRLWVDASVEGNPPALVGIIATTEQLQADAQMEGTSMFVQQLFEKQLGRQRQAFEAFVVSPAYVVLPDEEISLFAHPTGLPRNVHHLMCHNLAVQGSAPEYSPAPQARVASPLECWVCSLPRLRLG